jgi:Uma2 family endonuclease
MSLAAIPLRPPLREGDRLTSTEFLRRWDAMPELKHAELIDGVVFMPSPVSLGHGDQHVDLSYWLRLYTEQTPGCRAGGDSTWIMGPKDVPQPDIALRILPEYGGQSTVKGKYAGGAPELIVEVTGSTSSRDLGVKLDLYRRAGVREYITILLPASQVIWRQLVRGRYKEIAPDEDGLLRSRVFPGLWLDPAAVWDSKRSLRTAIEQGTRSPEHAAFVRRLVARKRK